MKFNIKDGTDKKHSFEEALELTGFGRYNIGMLATCCLLILAMYLDIFGYSVVMPAVKCDMALTTAQQGLLSAIPLIGVMLSSYCWGLSADTLGRRKTLLIAMPIGVILNFAATLAPTYASLATLKFLSASFSSSANAAAYVLMGESVPKRFRSRFIFLISSCTVLVQFVICIFALPVFRMNFGLKISWLSIEYHPWRFLMQIVSVPGMIGILFLTFMKESPKFLLSKNRSEDAVRVLSAIYSRNNRMKKSDFSVTTVYLDEVRASSASDTSFVRTIWNQTAPLFKSPLLKNNIKLYYVLLCAYMTSTGYTMWVPTMTNAYFNGNDNTGKTFCEVASAAVSPRNSTSNDCDNIIQPNTIYAVMLFSGVSGVCTVLLSFLVCFLGMRRTTLMIFSISITCGLTLLFVRIPLFSIAMFYLFLYVALVLGNINTYLVELNPTHLRGMATCLSVVVARGFGFSSVQLIGGLLTNHCTATISGYVVLVISGLVVATLLPSDIRTKVDINDENTMEVNKVQDQLSI